MRLTTAVHPYMKTRLSRGLHGSKTATPKDRSKKVDLFYYLKDLKCFFLILRRAGVVVSKSIIVW